jgi:hypothetical protein
MFKEERLKGEWFQPSEKLMAKVEQFIEYTRLEDQTAISLALSKDLKSNFKQGGG